MKKAEKRNDFIAQGSILAVAGLIVRLIGMMYRVPLTRIVGSEGMGYYNTAYELYALVLLLSSYSIPVAVSKLTSAKEAKKEYHNAYRIFLCAMCIAIVAGGAAGLVVYFAAEPIAAFMGWPSAAIPLKVLAPTILVFAVMGVMRGFFQGKKMMTPTALSQIVEQIVNAVISIVAALLLIQAYKDTGASVAAYGAAGGMLGTFTGTMAGLLVLILIFVSNKDKIDNQIGKDQSPVTESYRKILKIVGLTMLPIVLSQTIYQISGTLDNIIFGNVMQDLGYAESQRAIFWEAYANKYKWLYNVPVAISTAFGTSIVPSLIATFTEGNLPLVRKKVASAVKLNMMIAIPAAVGLAVLAKPILLLLFDHQEDVLSVSLMQFGSTAVIFFAFSTLTNGVFQGVNRMKIPVIHALISLGIHFVLLYVLLKVFHLEAYALVIGNVSHALIVCILNWISMRRVIGYQQEIKKTFLLPLVASAFMGIAAYLSYYIVYFFTKSNTVSVLFALVFSVCIYFIALIRCKALSERELAELPKGRLIVRVCKKLHILR